MGDRGLLIVRSNAVEGQETEFNQWYDDVHVPEVLAVPGVAAAQRYRLQEVDTPEVEGAPSLPPPAHRYVAVYELTGDPDDVMASFVEQITSGKMTLSDTMDMLTVDLSAWEPLGPRRESE